MLVRVLEMDEMGDVTFDDLLENGSVLLDADKGQCAALPFGDGGTNAPVREDRGLVDLEANPRLSVNVAPRVGRVSARRFDFAPAEGWRLSKPIADFFSSLDIFARVSSVLVERVDGVPRPRLEVE